MNVLLFKHLKQTVLVFGTCGQFAKIFWQLFIGSSDVAFLSKPCYSFINDLLSSLELSKQEYNCIGTRWMLKTVTVFKISQNDIVININSIWNYGANILHSLYLYFRPLSLLGVNFITLTRTPSDLCINKDNIRQYDRANFVNSFLFVVTTKGILSCEVIFYIEDCDHHW